MEKRASIAMIGTRGVPANYGGFETAVEEIGKCLVTMGHEVVVYSRPAVSQQKEYLGMKLVHLPSIKFKWLDTLSHTAISIIHLIFHRTDVVFLFNVANTPFIWILKMLRIPIVLHVDGIEWKRAKWRGLGKYYYLIVEFIAAKSRIEVIADSIAIKDYLFSRYSLKSDFIPYGAPSIFLEPEGVNRLGLDSKKYHLLVARFEPENHVLEIVQGYVMSKAELPLIVVGDASYGSKYREQVKLASKNDSRITFIGKIFDQELLNQLYANALTYLHGHSVGGTNPSLLRALGAGTPPICFDVPFNREVVGDLESYFFLPQEIGPILIQAEKHVEEWIFRGTELRENVTNKYIWNEVASKYEQLALTVIFKKLNKNESKSI